MNEGVLPPHRAKSWVDFVKWSCCIEVRGGQRYKAENKSARMTDEKEMILAKVSLFNC